MSLERWELVRWGMISSVIYSDMPRMQQRSIELEI